MKDKTIICRCEDVTLEEIRELIRTGATTPDEIKRLSRCGMGPCQGGTCRPLVLREVAAATGKSIDEIPMTTFRPPTRPIKLGAIAKAEDLDEAPRAAEVGSHD